MFFTFDGHRLMQNGSMKYWIFGHTHDRLEISIEKDEKLSNM